MAERVFVHIGLPKTATTYLQTILWESRDQLRAEGLLVPGAERRDHLWSSRLVRGEAARSTPDARAETAWDRLRAEVVAWQGRALVSHEFFAAASSEQAATMVAQLAPAEVHVVVTAREPLGLFAAGWQESLKNRATERMEEFATEESTSPSSIWNWRTLDLGLVLDRWGGVVPPERVHVLPLPRGGAPRDTIWHRFAGLLGLDSHAYDLGTGFANSSMGVVEAETLRRVNEHLAAREELESALERGNLLRTFLADERLVPRGGERYWPTPAQVEDARARGVRARDLVRERGFDVVGDPEDLLVPDDLPERRQVASVTDAEVADVATDVVAGLLADVRDLRREKFAHRREARLARQEVRALEARLATPPPPLPPLWRHAGSKVKQGLLRVARRT
ncbi:hypothetical protein [Nocardioides aurantiacus]|uniref:Sulfotransferase family protein n=1 Tax=Nocardioides aurantiacus TaxID=86796 RepID=A0A3N2CXZ1_9ACTN|nr:hypothetical protein [Nocardioides aurantiacus]ROR92405.1 hypothetical protein EDD33_3295 [Nocardioides aurantiacus]